MGRQARRRVVDLSHPISDGMVTYPGLPAPSVATYLSRERTADDLAPGVSFHIGRIEMVANTGTYLDAPFHYHQDGPDVAGLDPGRLVDLPCVVVDAAEGRGIPAELVPDGDLEGAAVLFRTGWSRHWRTPAYGTGSPHLTRAAVERLVAARPAVVGIDALNVDDVGDPSRPAHHLLLGAGVCIVEHLTGLDALPQTGACFTALPAPVRGMGTMPVRAVAVLPD